MTTVNYLSKSQMVKRAGMNALGYSDPKRDEILIRKGLPKSVEMNVRKHESEHIQKGEEGPFLGSIIGSVLGGLLGLDAADDAADAQVHATDAGIAEQRRQFDLAREDLAPYRTIGTQALNALGGIYGYQPYAAPQPAAPPQLTPNQLAAQNIPGLRGFIARTVANTQAQNALPVEQPKKVDPSGFSLTQPIAGTDYSAFFASPDYAFRRSEGMRDIGNSFAARGGAASGNALRALAEYNSGLAAGEFGNYFNRQAALAGIGQSATNTGIGVGQNTAANVGNLLGQAGSARASGILGQNAALTGALGGALDAWYNRGRPNNALNTVRGGSWG